MAGLWAGSDSLPFCFLGIREFRNSESIDLPQRTSLCSSAPGVKVPGPSFIALSELFGNQSSSCRADSGRNQKAPQKEQ